MLPYSCPGNLTLFFNLTAAKEWQKEIQMRNLNMEEINFVSGAGDTCDATSGVGDQTTLAQDIINAYEGLIEATVYIMERVTKAVG